MSNGFSRRRMRRRGGLTRRHDWCCRVSRGSRRHLMLVDIPFYVPCSFAIFSILSKPTKISFMVGFHYKSLCHQSVFDVGGAGEFNGYLDRVWVVVDDVKIGRKVD